MTHACLGSGFTVEQARTTVINSGLPHEEPDEGELARRVAELVTSGEVVGWVQGRAEFGSTTLGNRSVLADAREPGGGEQINARLKLRQDPRLPTCLVQKERAKEYFELAQASPFGLLAPRVREERRDDLAAVVRPDGTARVQTVCPEASPLLHDLLGQVERLSGAPLLAAASLCGPDEPAVNSPGDAVDCFEQSGLDRLALGAYLVGR